MPDEEERAVMSDNRLSVSTDLPRDAEGLIAGTPIEEYRPTFSDEDIAALAAILNQIDADRRAAALAEGREVPR
jgi:hypothetical protein